MKYKEITILKVEGNVSPIFQNILNAINVYLIRNFGAANDFNTIKDVVERANQVKENEINSIIPLSIYLGLGGTMIGIIMGLIFMPDVSSDEFEGAINMLVGGISTAMITSVIGLIVMVILTIKQKGAKVENERSKNNLYTFIQTDLMPVLTDTSATSAVTMQRNLNKFNQEFGQNVRNFNPIMEKMLYVSKEQSELMVMLKNMDLIGTAKMNMQLVKTVDQSANNFKHFTGHVQRLNDYLDQVRGDMQKLVDDRKSVIGAVSEVDMAMKDAVLELKKATDVQIQGMQDIVTSVSMPLKDFKDSHIESTQNYIKNINDALQVGLSDLQKHTQNKLDEFNKLVETDQPAFRTLISMQKDHDRAINQNLVNLSRSIEVFSQQASRETNSQKNIFDHIPNWVKYSAIGGGVLFVASSASMIIFVILFILS